MKERKLVSLDWAIKKILRSKANYVVLEGFLSELLQDDIKILAILESESNQDEEYSKFNRVDLKVENTRHEIILIELQYNNEFDYFQRMLFATSKAITEHLAQGSAYEKVVKVISVNILYFDLGRGEDYIYHGSTSFIGLHTKDQLKLSAAQHKLFAKNLPSELFPEYYLINVSKFDDVATNTLDEWIFFLKHETIKESFTAKGLKEASEILDLMKLSQEQRQAYERFLDDVRSKKSTIDSAKFEGKEEGLKEGRQEGHQEGRKEGLKEGIDGQVELVLQLLQDGDLSFAKAEAKLKNLQTKYPDGYAWAKAFAQLKQTNK